MKDNVKAMVAGTAFLMAGAANAAVSYEVISTNLLGDIITSGDSASFLPTEFSASSPATTTSDITVIRITSDQAITSIDYFASGDYSNLVDFSSSDEGTFASGELMYEAGSDMGSVALTVVGLGNPSSPLGQINFDWTASATLTFDAIDNVTEVFLTIKSDLGASVDSGIELAKIQTKLVDLETSAVPLPAAAWLFGAAVVAFGGMASRRRA